MGYRNGERFTLEYNAARWKISYLPDGSPLPTFITVGTNLGRRLVSFTLPMIANRTPAPVGLNEYSVMSEAHIKADDDGPTAKDKLVSAHETLWQEILDDHPHNAEYRRQIAEARKKLKWRAAR